MRENFNVASLAKLSRQELLSLLASYQSELCAASSESDRVICASRVAAIRAALAMQ